MHTSIDIDSKFAARMVLHGMLLPELVEDISRIKSRVVAQLSGDDFQGLGEGIDKQLILPSNAPGMLSQVPASKLRAVIACLALLIVCLSTLTLLKKLQCRYYSKVPAPANTME